eukprot:jgi/Mesvir1/18848/Mv03448-RA.1
MLRRRCGFAYTSSGIPCRRWTTGGFCSLHRRQAAQPYDRPYLRRPPAPPYRPYHPYYYPYMLHWSAPHISPNHVTVTHVYEPKTDENANVVNANVVNANVVRGGDGGVNEEAGTHPGPDTPDRLPEDVPVPGTPVGGTASTACGRP